MSNWLKTQHTPRLGFGCKRLGFDHQFYWQMQVVHIQRKTEKPTPQSLPKTKTRGKLTVLHAKNTSKPIPNCRLMSGTNTNKHLGLALPFWSIVQIKQAAYYQVPSYLNTASNTPLPLLLVGLCPGTDLLLNWGRLSAGARDLLSIYLNGGKVGRCLSLDPLIWPIYPLPFCSGSPLAYLSFSTTGAQVSNVPKNLPLHTLWSLHLLLVLFLLEELPFNFLGDGSTLDSNRS